jgi:hypothetical protein
MDWVCHDGYQHHGRHESPSPHLLSFTMLLSHQGRRHRQGYSFDLHISTCLGKSARIERIRHFEPVPIGHHLDRHFEESEQQSDNISTNLRILERVTQLGSDLAAWAKEIMEIGLRSFDEMAEASSGQYSYGDQLTLADVVLAPAVENALRYGVGISQYSTIQTGSISPCETSKHSKQGDWRHREDTPEEYRLEGRESPQL